MKNKDTTQFFNERMLINAIIHSNNYNIKKWLLFKIAKLLNLNVAILPPYVYNITHKYGTVKKGKYLSK